MNKKRFRVFAIFAFIGAVALAAAAMLAAPARAQVGTSGLFSQYDQDGNAFLNEDEFNTFLSDQGISGTGLFGQYDQDFNEGIDVNEFGTVLSDQGVSTSGLGTDLGTTDTGIGTGIGTGVGTSFTQQDISGLYSQYDQDANGILDQNEFNTFMSEYGLADTGQFSDYNTDFNQGLNMNEFSSFVQDEGVVRDYSQFDTQRPRIKLYNQGELTPGLNEIFTREVPGFEIGTNEFVIGPSPVIRAGVLGRLVFIENATGQEIAIVRDAWIGENDQVEYLVVEANVVGETEVAPQIYAIPFELFQVAPSPDSQSLIDNFVFVFTASEDAVLATEPIDPDDLVSLQGQLFIDPADVNLDADTGLLLSSRALALNDYPIMTPSDQEIAVLSDLVINLIDNQVLYAIVLTNRGGNTSATAMPISLLDYNEVSNEFLTNVREETINDSPPIVLREWRSPFERDFDSDIAVFWDADPFNVLFDQALQDNAFSVSPVSDLLDQ